MTPETVHLIAQDIRHFRGLLTAQADWARRQPQSATQIELYRRVNFWRSVLREAEQRLSVGDVGEAIENVG